jgi:hypothetical protein
VCNRSDNLDGAKEKTISYAPHKKKIKRALRNQTIGVGQDLNKKRGRVANHDVNLCLQQLQQ